ncbi:hypothetical protein DVH05_025265 [Phytophthora capsici]|nr:hypothetical protein DVH05_025265 [Phytophthora capsici]
MNMARVLLVRTWKDSAFFNALKRAAELVGRPDIVTKKDIDEFVEHQMTSRGEDLTKGTSWKVVLFFLRRLRDAGRDFIYRAIALDNFAVPGRRGVRVLSEIKVKNGVYIVAAYNHQSVGHAFVLTVQDKNRLIYDLEEGKCGVVVREEIRREGHSHTEGPDCQLTEGVLRSTVGSEDLLTLCTRRPGGVNALPG